jgi:hypothetical protein
MILDTRDLEQYACGVISIDGDCKLFALILEEHKASPRRQKASCAFVLRMKSFLL